MSLHHKRTIKLLSLSYKCWQGYDWSLYSDKMLNVYIFFFKFDVAIISIFLY